MKAGKIIIPVLAVAVAAVGGVLAYRYYYDRKVPNFTGAAELYIYPDTPVDSVVAMLCGDAPVRSASSVRRAFKEIASVHPGHYTVTESTTSMYAARMVSMGWQTPVNLVLSGTMRQDTGIARKISSQMMMDSLEVVSALRDSALLSRFGFTPQNVFALIIPDTYEVWWTDSMEEVLARQKAAYDAYWSEENLAKAKARGLSRMEVSILASIRCD